MKLLTKMQVTYGLARDEAIKGKMSSKSSLRISRFSTQQVSFTPWCFSENHRSPECHTVLFVSHLKDCAWSEQGLVMEEGKKRNRSDTTGLKLGTLGQEMVILEQGRRRGGCWAGRSWSTSLSHLWDPFCSSLKAPLGRTRFLPTTWVSH